MHSNTTFRWCCNEREKFSSGTLSGMNKISTVCSSHEGGCQGDMLGGRVLPLLRYLAWVPVSICIRRFKLDLACDPWRQLETPPDMPAILLHRYVFGSPPCRVAFQPSPQYSHCSHTAMVQTWRHCQCRADWCRQKASSVDYCVASIIAMRFRCTQRGQVALQPGVCAFEDLAPAANAA